jgi:hypothetical protein
VLPVISDYWDRAEFPFPLVDKMATLDGDRGVVRPAAAASTIAARSRSRQGPRTDRARVLSTACSSQDRAIWHGLGQRPAVHTPRISPPSAPRRSARGLDEADRRDPGRTWPWIALAAMVTSAGVAWRLAAGRPPQGASDHYVVVSG